MREKSSQKATNTTPKKRQVTAAGGYAYSDATYAKALVAFRGAGTVAEACRVAGISRSAWYDRVETDPAFQLAVETATEEVTDDLEREAIRRAKDGSDTLIIFLLKNRRAQYAEKLKVNLADDPRVKRTIQRVAELVLEIAGPEVHAVIAARLAAEGL